jgi:hypothetical protein
MRLPVIRVLIFAMLVCATVAFWAASAGFKAKQCLDGRLEEQQNLAWRGATITGEGCEVTTASSEVVLVPISGPPFEAGIAGVLSFVVLGIVVLILLARRLRRPSLRFDVG